jgi:hypothetical protein
MFVVLKPPAGRGYAKLVKAVGETALKSIGPVEKASTLL